MCDLGTMMSGGSKVYSSPIGPTSTGAAMGSVASKPIGSTVGELMKQGSGVFDAFGQYQEFADVESQRKQRTNQILDSTKQNLQLTSIEQGQRKGRMIASVGRTGVTNSGSAAMLLDKQDLYDEIALESIKQRGMLEIQTESKYASIAKGKKQTALGTALAKGAEFGGEAYTSLKGFEF
jgi:hypothetical protein